MEQFDGITYDPDLDGERLTRQFGKVMALMSDTNWRTLKEICEDIGGSSEAGVSARLRDARKPRFGSYRVEKRRRQGCKGLWEYRVLPPVPAQFNYTERQGAFL